MACPAYLVPMSGQQTWDESVSDDPPIFGQESSATSLPIYLPITEPHNTNKETPMERPPDRGLPTLAANIEKLQRELQQLHQVVKSTSSESRESTPRAPEAALVIKGK